MAEAKYVEFPFSFEDRFSGELVEVTYRFRRPTPQETARAQKSVLKDSGLAMRNLCVDVVHSDDKEGMLRNFEAWPGLATTMGTAIFQSIGVGNLGN